MNKNEFIVLRELNNSDSSLICNQRNLAKKLGFSLGLINKSINGLKQQELISEKLSVTHKAKKILNSYKPKNAIILAAGYGLRMVPINQNKPKALLTVNGKPLVERQIEYLNEIGIKDITIVVGFMKDDFEYLIDKYGVKLDYNKFYSEKNNLFSINCVIKKINNTYIIPCDIYCNRNPFNKYEYFTWYMVN